VTGPGAGQVLVMIAGASLAPSLAPPSPAAPAPPLPLPPAAPSTGAAPAAPATPAGDPSAGVAPDPRPHPQSATNNPSASVRPVTLSNSKVLQGKAPPYHPRLVRAAAPLAGFP